MPVRLVGDEAIAQHPLLLDHPESAPEAPRGGHDVGPKLVAIAHHRKVHRQVLERVVAGVRHQAVDAVRAVRRGPPPVGALVHLQEHPVVARRPHPRVGREREGGGAPRDDLLRQHRAESLVDQVDDPVDLGEAGLRGGREARVEDGALGGDDVDRPERPLVRRHLDLGGLRVEEEGADRAEAGHLGRALEGHVEARLDLVGRARQVHLDAVAPDPHAHLDGEADVAVSPVVVEESLRPVLAVRDGRDPLAKDPFRIVHELAGRRDHVVVAEAIHELDEAPHPEAGGRDLGVEVVEELARRPRVVADVVPHRLVAPPRFVELGPREEHSLGVHVRNVDDEPRGRGPDVEVVGGVRRVADEPVAVEDGDDDRDVGGVARPVVGVVVDDDVPVRPVPLHHLLDAFEVAGERADVERGRFGLAEGVVLGVEEPGAEVLGFPDDRRERHPVEDVPHLLGDGVERAADDLEGDRVEFAVGHDSLLFAPWAPARARRSVRWSGGPLSGLAGRLAASPTGPPALRPARRPPGQARRTCRLPYSLTSAAYAGGTSTVELCWMRTAGPATRCPALSWPRS